MSFYALGSRQGRDCLKEVFFDFPGAKRPGAKSEGVLKALAARPILMPNSDIKRYSPKSFSWWLHLYRLHGLEGLKPGYRSDRGKSRRITKDMAPELAGRARDFYSYGVF